MYILNTRKFASMFGRSVNGVAGLRFYGQASFKKRERAKDFLCAMIADQLVINKVYVDKDAARDYVLAFARPLMRYRRNFVWAPMFKILYGPVIKLMLTPVLIERLKIAVEVLQSLRMIRDQIKAARRWFGQSIFEHTSKVPWSLTKNGFNWFIASVLSKGNVKRTRKLYNMYRGVIPTPWLEIERHPMFMILQAWVVKLQDFISHYRGVEFWKDSRLRKWDKNELLNPMFINLELIGRKPLTKSRIRSLQASKYVALCYLICLIVFDRKDRLKWEFNLNSKICVRLEVAEDGTVLYNNKVVTVNSKGEYHAIRHRPSAIQQTGKIWAFLPSDLGSMVNTRRGRDSNINYFLDNQIGIAKTIDANENFANWLQSLRDGK